MILVIRPPSFQINNPFKDSILTILHELTSAATLDVQVGLSVRMAS